MKISGIYVYNNDFIKEKFLTIKIGGKYGNN